MLLIEAGLRDGLNPCSLITIIIFVTFLCSVRFRLKEKIWSGLFFVLSVFVMLVIIRQGLIEAIRMNPTMMGVSRVAFCMMASWCLCVAAAHIRDWQTLRRGGDKDDPLWIPFPFLPTQSVIKFENVSPEKTRRTFFFWIVLLVLNVGIGLGLTFLGAVFPTSIYPAALFYSFELRNLSMYSQGNVLFYSFLSVVPLIVVFWLFLWTNYSARCYTWMNRNITLIKSIASALYMSIGLGLLYVFI